MSIRGYLSDDEIIELVEKYIEEEIYNYAILIDGEWGSGKTYFIKNVLINKIEEKERKKVIYISLYGIKNISDISNELYISLVDKNVGQPLRKVITTGAKFGADVMKFLGLELSSYGDEVKGLINLKDYILIFDDLERCNCNINEVLGFINNFVEHEGIKVILIANENEIGKNNEVNNQELKYLIASNNNISYEGLIEEKNNNKDKISILDIKQRTKLIFDEKFIYNQIKEKLIGITVKYSPNFEKIYLNLIDKCIKDEDLTKILKSNLIENLNYAKDKMHFNLRTYQFFLSKVERINKIIIRKDYNEYENIMKKICEYSYRVCILFKSGSYKYPWEKESLYDNIELEPNNWFSNILGFKFIDDFIIDSKLDEVEVITAIELYLEEERSKRSSELPQLIYEEWWERDENDIRNSINKIIRFIKEDDAFIDILPKLLKYLITLENIGFETKIINNIESIVINRIKKERICRNIYDYSVVFQSEESYKRYKKIIDNIKSEMETLKYLEYRKLLNSYLDYEDWGIELYDYLITLKDDNINIQEKGFISNLDIIKLEEKIKNSNSKNISYFRYTITEVYNFSNIKEFYKKDSDNIDRLIKFIDKILIEKDNDIIKKKNLEMLMGLLKEKYDLLV